ncbi:ribonuclease H [Trichonephila clavipes]|nr:ribonuclease H [Trichonephila clavipes]
MLVSTSIIKEKGLKTIAKYPQHDFVFAYTDGSSDETFLNGDSGVFMTTPSDANYQRVIGAGAIASCFTCEIQAIIEVLDLYETLPILEQTRDLVIFCDSRAAFQAILNGGSRITEEICSRLFRLLELDKVCFFE